MQPTMRGIEKRHRHQIICGGTLCIIHGDSRTHDNIHRLCEQDPNEVIRWPNIPSQIAVIGEVLQEMA